MKIGNLIWLVVGSLFIGFVVFALPISLIPAATKVITLPLICKDGTYQVKTYSNGDNNYSTDYCINQAGEKRDITGLVLLVPGLIFSIVIFIAILVVRAGVFVVGRLGSAS
jgi:hypothetical protein